MSRSRRKNPIMGLCSHSEKQDKKIWHRRFRRRNKVRIQKGLEPVDFRSVSNPWDMAKDGKCYWPDWLKIYRK